MFLLVLMFYFVTHHPNSTSAVCLVFFQSIFLNRASLNLHLSFLGALPH